ncbi:hypothetical protein RBEMOGI_1174 [Rickettsia bellii str. RML Mogi]|nr:hypothetical protein RBEMOGI_1174 [Rickettsia bellii str. RML Mogi]
MSKERVNPVNDDGEYQEFDTTEGIKFFLTKGTKSYRKKNIKKHLNNLNMLKN